MDGEAGAEDVNQRNHAELGSGEHYRSAVLITWPRYTVWIILIQASPSDEIHHEGF